MYAHGWHGLSLANEETKCDKDGELPKVQSWMGLSITWIKIWEESIDCIPLCDFFDDFQGMVLKFCSDYSRIHFSAVNISTNGGYYVSDHKGKKAGR